MAWVVLVLSGMLEAVWATALSASENFTRKRPTVVFAVSLILSMVGLAWAMTSVVWGFITGSETFTWLRGLLLVLLVGSVVGLKVVS